MYVWDQKIRLSDLTELKAWIIFRHVRWKDKPPRCIYCQSPVKKNSSRKNKTQFFYKCTRCNKNFTDLTGTPFHKTRLRMKQILLLTVLIRNDIPINRVYQVLGIGNTTAFRYSNEIKEFELCERLVECLKDMDITHEVILRSMAPNLKNEMKYKKWYV